MSRLAMELARGAMPPAAVEIGSQRVSAVSLEIRGGRPVVTGYASEPVPEGALTPSLTGQNVHDRAALVAAIARALEQVGRPRRIGLVIPDPVTKVSLVRFERVADRSAELDQLIRWQVRKAAPFPIDEALVSHVAGARTDEGQEFVVSVARRTAIEEYESLCTAAGAHAGIVDLSTFNVANVVLAGSPVPTGDWLLVNLAPDWASIAIMRGPHLIFFRSRGAVGEGTLVDLAHQTSMYYEDRLQGQAFDRVLVCGASTAGADHAGDVLELRRSLEARLAAPFDTVDARTAASLADPTAAGPALLDMLAPLVGLLVRDQEAAAA
jgi:Tfp pilus assembly PilM family ATPase